MNTIYPAAVIFSVALNNKKIALILLCVCGAFTCMAGDRLQSLGKPSAVATFESIGITCGYSGDDNGDAVCLVKYRKKGGKKWKRGYPLWRDSKRHEFRGSLVLLSPGKSYEIMLEPGDPQGAPKPIIFNTKTWREKFPIAKTVYITGDALKTGFTINESGTPDGYILYTAKPGQSRVIDVKNKVPICIRINASYVIIRGLTLRGAQTHAIDIENGHDIVIEKCDISNWGDIHKDGWGYNVRCAVYSNSKSLTRVIMQRNTIHNPRSDSNNWMEARVGYNHNSKHPAGPQAVGFYDSAGNHVIRYNHVYSDSEHYYNDIFGAGANFSLKGFPNCDSDIYGNILENCWDDAIETEGANNNVRVWGNYIENAYQAQASRATSVGPLYIWRNVCVIGYRNPGNQSSASYHKSGGRSKKWDNGVFVFHNTAVMPDGKKIVSSGTRGIHGAMQHTTTSNNIFNVEKSIISELKKRENNRFLNDLCSGRNWNLEFSLEATPIKGVPKFISDFGLNRKTGRGVFYQTPKSPGYNCGIKLPNFNSGVPDGKPDLGAHEAGTPPMQFGPKAYLAKSSISSKTKPKQKIKSKPKPKSNSFFDFFKKLF